jgi:antitoxin MazE
MVVSVIPIGNFRGIRIPDNVISALNIEDTVEMEVQDNEIIIRPKRKMPRAGWDEAFAKMHSLGEDTLLISDNLDDDSFEWE